MATPGYPQMGHGPMMGGGMPPRPVRRGTPKAVPVVVSAGLAVGVFCGLLFGLGTGDKADAKTGPSKGNNLKHEDDPKGPDPGAAPAGIGATTGLPRNNGISVGSAVAAAAGSGGGMGSATVAMAGSGSAAAAPAVKTIKLTVDIDPDTAAAAAEITIDGKAITGKTADLAPDTKQVHLQITATGFHAIDQKVDISGGDEANVKIKMLKRSAGGGGGSPGFGGASSGGNHVQVAQPRPRKPPANNGIIDI